MPSQSRPQEEQEDLKKADPKQAATICAIILAKSGGGDGSNGLHSVDSITTAAKSVCKVKLDDGSSTGSGFFCELPPITNKLRVVGIMTNNHVIGSSLFSDDSAEFEVCFESEKRCSPIRLTVKDDVAWWFTDEKLDATFIQLLPETVTKILDGKSIKPLEFSKKVVREDQEVAIIQYPLGELQKVAFARVKEISGLNFKHTVSTDYGSSGSPVIEVDNWSVVGIHKARGESSTDQYNWAVSAHAVVDAVVKKWRKTFGESKGSKRSKTKSAPAAAVPDDIASALESYYAPGLHKAAKTGNLKALKEILHEFVDKFSADFQERLIEHCNAKNLGRTALLEAAHNGRLNCVRFLVLDCQANVFAKDSSKLHSTALHLAAEYGQFDVVTFLLQTQPELLEFRNKLNDTALNMAAFGGHLRIVELLVNKKQANIENKGELGRTPLMRAVVNGHLPIVRFLAEKGAVLEARDSTTHKNTAIHLAAYFGYYNIVAYLLQLRPGLAKVHNGLSRVPLFYAQLPVNKSDVIELLQI